MNRADCCYMPKSPYKGLVPYSELDRLFFFGREEDRKRITEQLKAWRLTVLYGASGVGKSSVLRAGVAYHLRQAAQKKLDTTGKPGWAIIVFPPVEGKLAREEVSWQKDPVHGIRKQLKTEISILLGKSETEIDKDFEREIARLLADVPSPPQNHSLVDTLKACANLIRDEDGSSRLFIILDQFEEYLVLLQKRIDNAFLDEFQKAVNSSEVSTNFLISIREDSLATLDRLVNIQEQDLFKNRLEIKNLNEQSAREAILKPVVEYNRQKIILEKFLDDSRLTILAGKKETHKSTVLRSAIVPYLKEHGLNVIFFNSWHISSQQRDLLAVFKTQIFKALYRSGSFPSPKLELSLVETLNTWIKHINGKQSETGASQFCTLAFLRGCEDLGLWLCWLMFLQKRDAPSETRLFVILDQFEEYFWKPQETDPDQKFINELLTAINDNSLNIKFLISIREEWFPALDPYKDRFPDSCQYYLQLNAEGENFIEEKQIGLNKVTPNEQKKRRQELEKKFIHIEPNLDKYILEEFKKKSKESEEKVKPNQDKADDKSKSETKLEVETPYLQLVMTSLWNNKKKYENSDSESLTQEKFQELGSLKGIVERHFKRKISRLSPKESDIAVRIFYHLVPHSGDKIALSVEDLLEYVKKEKRTKFSDNDVKDLLNKLSDINPSKKEEENYRILRSVPGRVGKCHYEIFHDMLAKPILAWLTKKEKQKAIQQTSWWIGRLVIFVIGAVSLLVTYGIYLADTMRAIPESIDNIKEARNKGQISGLLRAIPAENYWLDLLKQLKWQPWLWLSLESDKDILKNTLQKMLTNIPEKNIFPVSTQSSLWSVSYEGNFLAAGSDDGTVRLWNLQGKEPREIPVPKPEPPSTVYSVSLSHEGNLLATGSADGTVRLWDWDIQGKESREIPVPKLPSPVLSVSLSPNGNRLVAGSADGTVRLWEIQDQELREIPISDRPVSKPLFAVQSVSLSHDRNRLAAGSANGTVRL